MASWQELFPLLGHALLWSAALLALPGVRRWSGRRRGLTLAGIWAAVWLIPVAGGNLLTLSRGLLGDLSLTTLAVLCAGHLRGFGVCNDYTRPLRRPLAAAIILLDLILYAATLGYLEFDPYGAGYQPQILLVGLALILPLAWKRQPGLALGLLAGLIAFRCHWLPSPNLWDYLRDPVLWLIAWKQIITPPRVSSHPERPLPPLPRSVCSPANSAHLPAAPRNTAARTHAFRPCCWSSASSRAHPRPRR